ncbi:hypothetical protein AAFF_G00276320 [Aldrovandia affinis]|uniref:Uncharacterized protein n=1 Tax=Aldrovandia affinis TaxID=143900 RepID=A0AAD7W2J8_9TELE|nr:hypothetical protein AAFF_G00276320 [Aldrovandia affinis]
MNLASQCVCGVRRHAPSPAGSSQAGVMQTARGRWKWEVGSDLHLQILAEQAQSQSAAPLARSGVNTHIPWARFLLSESRRQRFTSKRIVPAK